MILDETTEFCDNVDISGSAGTALVGDVLDLNSVGKPGITNHLKFMMNMAVAAAGAGTITVILASDAQAAIATDGSATIHYQSQDFSINDLEKGAEVAFALPHGIPTAERYLGVLVVRSGTVSAGNMNAFLTLDNEAWQAYPEANS